MSVLTQAQQDFVRPRNAELVANSLAQQAKQRTANDTIQELQGLLHQAQEAIAYERGLSQHYAASLRSIKDSPAYSPNALRAMAAKALEDAP